MASFSSSNVVDSWSGLVPELIELILNQLTHLSNHLHFASVCSSWRSVALNYRCHHRLPCQLPLLMLPWNPNNETRPFFSLSSGNTKEFHLPEIQRKWCCGSSEGWIVTLDVFTGEIQLFNPVSRGCIQLPSISTFYYPQLSCEPELPSDWRYIYKSVVSSSPNRTSDYVVVAIVTNQRKLAYYKPGGANRWITMTTQWFCFEDVIFYKGLFYAVSNNGPVLSFDFSSEPPIVTEITGRPPEGRVCDMYYLVESIGELLLVLRNYRWPDDDDEDDDNDNDVDDAGDDDDYKNKIRPWFKTINFKVRKLDERKRKWIQMKSIGDDRILFLGNSCSMSFSAQEFPECKGNSIYFNDDYYYWSFQSFGYHDLGVFNFKNGSVKPFYGSPPIWNTPTFWFTPEAW